jgi:hypothetical protein
MQPGNFYLLASGQLMTNPIVRHGDGQDYSRREKMTQKDENQKDEKTPSSVFEVLSSVDVSEHIETKNGFGYVSWPFVVRMLREADPRATWEVKRFKDEDGKEVPFLETRLGFFVEVAVTCGGITLSQIHPVLDGETHRTLQAPTAFDINTSIQRCLVKAAALHGLGLSVYAGEDLPSGEKKPEDASSAAESNESQKKEPSELSVQMAKEIEVALANAKRDIKGLMRWLQKDEDTALADLTDEELKRALKALTQPAKAAANG